MSISYETYVGPYARCANGTKEENQQYISCPNADCENHQKALRTPYCEKCGTKVQSLTRTFTAEAVDAWDVGEKIDDRLTTPGDDAHMTWSEENHAHLWMPNVSTPWRNGHLEERADFFLQEIQLGDCATEISAFADFFAPELTALRAAYGANAVSIHWGIIQYYY